MDAAVIRLVNLKSVCKDRKLGPAELVKELGSRYSFWREILNGEKSFGEKLARRIEEGLKLPPGRLDEPHGAEEQPPINPAMELLPLQEGETDLLSAYRLLSPGDRAKIMQTVFDLVATERRLCRPCSTW